MKIHGLDKEKIYKAIEQLTDIYDGNIELSRELTVAKNDIVDCRIATKQHGNGTKVYNYRNLIKNSPCWHVYGDFIEILLNMGATRIDTMTNKVYTHDDNWLDYSVTGMGHMASEQCLCER